MKRSLTALFAVAAALVAAAPAAAHSHLSPPVILSGTEQVITLSVPTETEDANTTRVELTPPPGFRIGGFTPAPGWNRHVEQTGSGEDTLITKVTWDGGKVPPEESATFQFLGEADSSQTYTFSVRQTYSDGTVEDWSGPEDSDTPAPTIEVADSLGGGGGGSSTLAVIALVVGVLALAAAIAALVAGSGRRSLA
jgi:uncharacterized protein YcnI